MLSTADSLQFFRIHEVKYTPIPVVTGFLIPIKGIDIVTGLYVIPSTIDVAEKTHQKNLTTGHIVSRVELMPLLSGASISSFVGGDCLAIYLDPILMSE
jgi:hypothetical protein